MIERLFGEYKRSGTPSNRSACKEVQDVQNGDGMPAVLPQIKGKWMKRYFIKVLKFLNFDFTGLTAFGFEFLNEDSFIKRKQEKQNL